jgi:hypothetical protein
MREYGRRRRATSEFAAARGWTLLDRVRSDAERQALLEQLHGEPFHPPQPVPGIPLDQVDPALERLSVIAEHFTAPTGP